MFTYYYLFLDDNFVNIVLKAIFNIGNKNVMTYYFTFIYEKEKTVVD